MFSELPKNHFGAILADPPWTFNTWAGRRWNGEYRKDGTKIYSNTRSPEYETMSGAEIQALPVKELALEDSVLLLWCCWPNLRENLETITAWGFQYKTCAFCWVKGDNTQPHFFQEEIKPEMNLGYWTRANSEFCLLATRGKPKRLNADVRQAIIAPARQHSRKPDGIHERIERLVAGPYLELFARQKRDGWTVWGNQTEKFAQVVNT